MRKISRKPRPWVRGIGNQVSDTPAHTDDGPRCPSGSITPSPYAIVPCRASRPVKLWSRATRPVRFPVPARSLAGPSRTINARLRPVNSWRPVRHKRCRTNMQVRGPSIKACKKCDNVGSPSARRRSVSREAQARSAAGREVSTSVSTSGTETVSARGASAGGFRRNRPPTISRYPNQPMSSSQVGLAW